MIPPNFDNRLITDNTLHSRPARRPKNLSGSGTSSNTNATVVGHGDKEALKTRLISLDCLLAESLKGDFGYPCAM